MQFFSVTRVKHCRMDKTQRYTQLMDEHRRIIYKVCYMYASDAEHLKDLHQEVAANVWQGLDTFRGQSSTATWVYRVALNTCITYFRRNDRHAHSLTIDEELDVANERDDTQHSLMLKQMYELIASLGKLDKALIMLWLDEYSYDEIAAISGLSRNNVASRLLRARRRLISLSNR